MMNIFYAAFVGILMTGFTFFGPAEDYRTKNTNVPAYSNPDATPILPHTNSDCSEAPPEKRFKKAS